MKVEQNKSIEHKVDNGPNNDKTRPKNRRWKLQARNQKKKKQVLMGQLIKKKAQQ